MGPKDDQIREAQRTLPQLYSHLRTMSTVGAASEHAGRGACHFDLEGYAQFARFLSPLVEQDNYGWVPPQPITAPNLRRAWFTSAAREAIALDFGQPVVWQDQLKQSLYLDQAVAPIRSGSVSGNVITLQLTAPSNARTITYLTGRDWDGKPAHLLFGANGIAALTFCEVAIASSAAAEPPQVRFEPPLESLRQYETPEWFADAKLGIDLQGLASVTLLGAPGKWTFHQEAGELRIQVPAMAPHDSPAHAFKPVFSGPIPMLD
jgi:hypothetical protein